MLDWVRQHLGLTAIIGIIGLVLTFLSLQFLYDFGISLDPMIIDDVNQGSTAQTKIQVDFGLLYNKDVSLRAEPVQDIDIRFEPHLITDKDKCVSEGTISVSEDAAAGTHIIQIIGTGSDGKQHNCTLELNVVSTKGFISIMSPVGANIYLDGMDKGKTPTILNNIEQGSYRVTLKLDGYEEWTDDINVDVGKDTEVVAELSAETEPTDPDPGMPDIKITYPSNADTVNIQENVTGTAKNVPKGQIAWLIIYPHTAYKYYPVNRLNILNEQWSVPAQFGELKDAHTQFDITIMLADQDAQKQLNEYLDTCIKTKTWPGITTLPVGVRESTKITVTKA